MSIRKQYTGSFKGQLALEAVKELKTVSELASAHEVHPNQIKNWKSHLVSHVGDLFEDKRRKGDAEQADLVADLYRQIGQLSMELEWFKKSRELNVEARRALVDWRCPEPVDGDHPDLSVSRQAELLGLSRSGLYYQPVAVSCDLLLMGLIDEIYTEFPYYGSRRIQAQLDRQGQPVCRERVRRLMREMGIEAIYPKPQTSRSHPDHKVYPYLLRNVTIERVNQVWSCDITYIRLKRGWLYLIAVMDWFSRYVLAWELSQTMAVDFCLVALERALARGRPEIFNTDQGSQFTSHAFTGKLSDQGIRISMDGRGRAFDNIFNERLWRSVKYEEVYLKDYESPKEARQGIGDYFDCYNRKRLHQALDYRAPAEVYGNTGPGAQKAGHLFDSANEMEG